MERKHNTKQARIVGNQKNVKEKPGPGGARDSNIFLERLLLTKGNMRVSSRGPLLGAGTDWREKSRAWAQEQLPLEGS